ncbi:MAG: aminotransferase class I/II-fold pyridoxal phosphate-dependent enzyme [Spirochaetia bacterium]|nr:aminotransferase class I/II-fold pyridoxal phosphate-dependent enzyme [Spirochaetia bacterium]
MGLDKIKIKLTEKIEILEKEGRLKGVEKIICGIKPPENGYGIRFLLKGFGDKEFLRMNSNSYLGLCFHPEVIKAEEEAAKKYGTGPGAVRFISGTFEPHIMLEDKLAEFHKREAAMIFSSAYSAVLGILPSLITEDTIVISDELNHNCIIKAIGLSKPLRKKIYPHLSAIELNRILVKNAGKAKRAVVVTDGVFSMRGDHTPLDKISEICREHESSYEEGVITIADDSHGIGAFGKTGRGTEEITSTRVDILAATLGKALGVNGGYIVSDKKVIEYFRETAALYIYSNSITASESAAALKALEILDSSEGIETLENLRKMTMKLKEGLESIKLETLPGRHPIVPLLLRDTKRTKKLVQFLFENGILATGLSFPVVPKGEEEIRFQVSASHTEKDIDYLIEILHRWKTQ